MFVAMSPVDAMLAGIQRRHGTPWTLAAVLSLEGAPLSVPEVAALVSRRWRNAGRLWWSAAEDGTYRWRVAGRGDEPPPVYALNVPPGASVRGVVASLLERALPERPGGLLWEVRVLPWREGRQALVFLAHHALLDGSSVGTVMRLLCDDAGGLTGAQVAAAGETVFAPRFVRRLVEEVECLRGVIVPASVSRHPAGAGRSVAWSTVGHDVVRRARQATGEEAVTVNDVVLAAFAGALRAVPDFWRGSRPPARVYAAVPVDLRPHLGLEHRLGNVVSSVRLRLPLHVDDPVGRLRAVHRAMAVNKARGRARGGMSLATALSRLGPRALDTAGEWLMANPRMVTVSCSNFRLSDAPLRLAGRRVDTLHVVPCLPPRMSTLAAFTSYAGTHTFSVTADGESGTHVVRLAESFAREVGRLVSRQPGRPT
ncbi:WS/DGAT domain-containing protein [Streptomyces sp. NPDC093546]|uniref:WS/DGAT domain-containing protein n=1 Tax=Streptomyces sp. NPDC093546 TaxID=3366040 RepID=UPI0037F687AE